MRMRQRRLPQHAVLLWCLGAAAPIAAPIAAQGPASSRPTSDSAAVAALVTAFYAANSGPAGATHDWAPFRSFFRADARLVSVVRDSAGRLAVRESTPDEYVSRADPAMRETGFEERSLGMRIAVYGGIAQVWSAYEARRGASGSPVRGINGFDLVLDDGRWRIAQLIWTNERAAGTPPALPERP